MNPYLLDKGEVLVGPPSADRAALGVSTHPHAVKAVAIYFAGIDN
jgi:hypothetical protein